MEERGSYFSRVKKNNVGELHANVSTETGGALRVHWECGSYPPAVSK